MHYRELGATGVKVSEIGMGCNRLGEKGGTDNHWTDLVRKAVDLGVTLFDTSESYNGGRSEELLGTAIAGRDDIMIATKVSRIPGTNTKEFSSARIIQRCEESLRKLKRDRIDLYQLHGPSLGDITQYDWPVAMAKLKEAGKIRFVGVSIHGADSGTYLIEHGLVDALQVEYNMVEPGVGQEVFPAAEKAGVAILVRQPMAQGILTGKFRPGEPVAPGHRALNAGDDMETYIRRAEAFRGIAGPGHASMGQFALRYAISPSAVSAAIPGARRIDQLEMNVAASNGKGLSAGELREIAEVQSRF
jgi:aryl-alcohol dehydrogenase-like predicted oxidoreductase